MAAFEEFLVDHAGKSEIARHRANALGERTILFTQLIPITQLQITSYLDAVNS